ncbi:MAG TPA: PilZ domain-containing protein [Gammaproteobacteria bacterium]|nr:PilZ domain-containing protein [Gammaproteobacteria bacterium]
MASPKTSAERRLYKRFDTDIPVEIITETEAIHSARGVNISLAGMQLRCDREALRDVAPRGEKTTPDQSPAARLRFNLPSPGEQPLIEVDCRIVLVRRVSEREYHLHIQYEFFQGNGYNQLEDYVDAMLEKSPL